jgi:hypothetical protein
MPSCRTWSLGGDARDDWPRAVGPDDVSAHEVVFTPAARRAMDALPMVAIPALALIIGDLAEYPTRVGKACTRHRRVVTAA